MGEHPTPQGNFPYPGHLKAGFEPYTRTGKVRCQGTSKSTHGQCQLPAIDGGWVCKRYHGGGSPQVQRLAAERQMQRAVNAELADLGIPVEVDQAEALMAMVHSAYGAELYLRRRVIELDEVYGPTFHATGIPTGEGKPHVLWAMWRAEADRVAQFSALALRSGVDERRLRLDEERLSASVDLVERALDAALAALGLTAAQVAEGRRLLGAEVRRLELAA